MQATRFIHAYKQAPWRVQRQYVGAFLLAVIAEELGFHAIHFEGAERLRERLVGLGCCQRLADAPEPAPLPPVVGRQREDQAEAASGPLPQPKKRMGGESSEQRASFLAMKLIKSQTPCGKQGPPPELSRRTEVSRKVKHRS